MGCPESWSFTQVCEYGGPVFEWYAGDDDFAETLERRLDECHVEGVDVVLAGHERTRVYLCAHLQAEVDDFGSVEFEPGDMNGVRMIADPKLAHAIELLGITPTADRPAWHLVTQYG